MCKKKKKKKILKKKKKTIAKVGGVSPRYGIEQIREGLHPRWIIPPKGEVHPSTIYIYIYIYHLINIEIPLKKTNMFIIIKGNPNGYFT